MDQTNRDNLFRFVCFDPFPSQAKAAGLTEDDLIRLEKVLNADPEAGDVVKGTNGVRKVRFAIPGSGRGKSGSCRVFYAYVAARGHILLVALIRKSSEANLSKADRNTLADVMARTKTLYDKGLIR